MPLFIILALAIALGTVLFALQNTTRVIINFFGLQFQDSLALILLLTLVIGVLVGVLVTIPSVLRRNWRISGQKRQVQNLDAQLQAKDQAIMAESQKSEQMRASFQDLLTALGATDPATGLLRGDTIASLTSYRLQQMAAPPGPPRPISVCVYLLDPNLDERMPIDGPMAERLRRAIAHRLKATTAIEDWLHHDGQGRFGCIAAGLDIKAATNYGEAIRASFADQPLKLDDGTSIPMTVSLGGAIGFADSPQGLDAFLLKQQAENALDQAKQRGRNRFRLVEVRS
ncbi:lipopolysaccharide assembly protein LapA domain-containing protein [Leptolyngbya sp. FACHB-8]|uniref:GGDEF domain-containing protein n=1 Tax=unclassified Leptolyngbya TaxID=2650499 RepID=UPI0016883EA5|nr:lipopolysaccharide assembly protein LapA domain-containing protein [Leptolyngbya sp. FACHB-8]MBD1913091.1 DUF1049 domain-containing protein [Leptolyngbya sp. FACHB-8]